MQLKKTKSKSLGVLDLEMWLGRRWFVLPPFPQALVSSDTTKSGQISLGDQSNYYLSTASNHLGVIMAASEAGNAMYPISWKEFKDPVTGAVESRKVAKPF